MPNCTATRGGCTGPTPDRHLLRWAAGRFDLLESRGGIATRRPWANGTTCVRLVRQRPYPFSLYAQESHTGCFRLVWVRTPELRIRIHWEHAIIVLT